MRRTRKRRQREAPCGNVGIRLEKLQLHPKPLRIPGEAPALPERAAGSISSTLWGQTVPCRRRKGPKAWQEIGDFCKKSGSLAALAAPLGVPVPQDLLPLPGSHLEEAGILLSSPTNKLLLFQGRSSQHKVGSGRDQAEHRGWSCR